MNTVSIPFFQRVRGRYWLFGPAALAVLFLAGYWPRYACREEARGGIERGAAESAPGQGHHRGGVAGRPLSHPAWHLERGPAGDGERRATGYVAHFRADIGDRVHAGDVLADLESARASISSWSRPAKP